MPPTTLDKTNGNGEDPAVKDAVQQLPFVLGARAITQRFHDRTDTVTANAQQVGPVDVLARGFLRNIVLEVELSGGVDADDNAAFGDDGIFGIFDNVKLTDPAGTTLVDVSGHQLYLINKYLGVGSLATIHDPKQSPAYDVSDEDDGNGTFVLRVPLEISARDALGALVNRSASATFKLQYTVAPSSTVFGTIPDGTLPDCRVKAYVEYWDPPAQGASHIGQPVAMEPPALDTVQFCSSVPYTGLSSGSQKVRLNRTGNMVRAIIATLRASGSRNTANLPDDIALTYDGHDIYRGSLSMLRANVAERLGLTAAEDAAGGLDTGTVVWQFDDDLDGVPGNSMRSRLLPTTTGTDLRIEGDFDGGDVLHVVTVDVAPAGPIFG